VAHELVRLLGQAAEQGSGEARQALAARFQAEMQRKDRDVELLQQLGQYVSAEVLR
jgi:hypothetical protein